MEESLQVGVGLQHGGSDENVGVAHGFFRLLTDECEEGCLGDGGWGLSCIDRAKESGGCGVAMLGLLVMRCCVDRFGVNE